MSTVSKLPNFQPIDEFEQIEQIIHDLNTNQHIKFHIGSYTPDSEERFKPNMLNVAVSMPNSAFNAGLLLSTWFDKLINSDFDDDYYLINSFDYLIIEIMNNELFTRLNETFMNQKYLSNIHKILIIYIAYYIKNELNISLINWFYVLHYSIMLIKEIDDKNRFDYYTFRELSKYKTLLIDLFYDDDFDDLDFDFERVKLIYYIDQIFDLLRRKYRIIHDFNSCNNEIKLNILIKSIRERNKLNKMIESKSNKVDNKLIKLIIERTKLNKMIESTINNFDVNELLYFNKVIETKFINIYEFINDYNRLLILGGQFNITNIMIENDLTLTELNEFFELIYLISLQINRIKPNETKDVEYHKFQRLSELNINLYNIENDLNETIRLIKEINSLINC